MRSSSARAPWRRALLGLALAAGCVGVYKPPSLDEPQATVNLRLTYHVWAGPKLKQSVHLNDQEVTFPSAEAGGTQGLTRAIRVPTRPTHWVVSATFFHEEVTADRRTPVSADERTCPDKQVCDKPTFRKETEVTSTPIPHASCARELDLVPERDGNYLLAFDFHGDKACTLACAIHRRRPDGTEDVGPCLAVRAPSTVPAPTAPTDARAD